MDILHIYAHGGANYIYNTYNSVVFSPQSDVEGCKRQLYSGKGIILAAPMALKVI